MTFKGLIFILVLLFLCTDAKRRGGYSRYSSSNSSNKSSSSSPGITILGIIGLILCCGCSIGWKIFKCHRKEERRERVQQQINTLIDRHDKRLQPSTINQWNKTDVKTKLSADRSNTDGFILVPLSVQRVDNALY